LSTVHFIRHAQPAHAPTYDPGLSAQGVRNAKYVSRWLRTFAVEALFTSPLRRALDTAQIFAEVMNLPATVDARLRERANWGDLPGQSFDDFVDMWSRCSVNRAEVPPVGDSSIAAGKRLESFVEAVVANDLDRTVVAVTHGGVLADFLRSAFSRQELDAISPQFCADPYDASVVPECSVTTIAVHPDSMRCMRIAFRPMLRGNESH
jgi:broad specificity phosphatase PhoE